MTSRRSFLRSSLVLGSGLLLGDAALEAFERLTHRKVFAFGAPYGREIAHPTYSEWATYDEIKTHKTRDGYAVHSTHAIQWNFRITPLASPTEPLRVTRL